MKSAIVKRSISVGGHKTSVSLEGPFWNGLKEIAERRNLTVSQIVAEIDAHRNQGNLSVDHTALRARRGTRGCRRGLRDIAGRQCLRLGAERLTHAVSRDDAR